MIGVFSNMNGSMKNDVVFAFMQTCSRIGEKMDVWISLLPEEYRNDVHGVPWAVICCTLFIGCLFIWIFLWRMKSKSRKRKEAQADDTVKELRLQLEAVMEEKLEKENKLKAEQTEMESKREELDSAYQNINLLTTEKNNMQSSFTEFRSQYEQLRHTLENMTGELDQKNNYIDELLDKYQSLEKGQDMQQQLLSDHEKSLSKLDNLVKETEESKRGMEITINKQKEKIKALEKAKGDTKKEGKTWKDQAGKLNEKIEQLEERLHVEVTENEQSKQEIDVLKDCLLQLRGVQEALGSDEDGEVSIENQKMELKALIDVHEIKKILKQTESQKTHLACELEAERKSRLNTEAKISELEGEIQCNDAMKNKLEHDKQMLDSKLTVMQEFYAKREVEIQSKLGKEQTKLESNSFLLEERQQQEIELVKQLEIYKKMNEDSKRQYEDSERRHKQEIVAFEKKAHENWLACREAERKNDESFKQINQLHMELADLQHRLHIEREPIIRPRPERHGPPGAPPPFGPSRRGIPPSPVHFRNGPPETSRRSPMIPRRPPSPVNSLNEDQIRSHSPTGRPRPDRPPSAQSLPSGDRRPPSHGPFIPPASHGPPGRSFGSYREGIPPQPRPPLHRPPYSYPRGPPDSRTRDPTFSSPYMDRPTIPPSISPGPHLPDFSNNTQGSLHAPPPIIRGSDRGDRPPSMSYSTPTNVGPPLYDNKPGMIGPNPFRRV